MTFQLTRTEARVDPPSLRVRPNWDFLATVSPLKIG